MAIGVDGENYELIGGRWVKVAPLAISATKLATARAITLSGAVTGTADFDGTAPVAIVTAGT